MTKEVQAAVQLIQKNISEDESITPIGRVKALINIENSVLNMDESLVSNREALDLGIYSHGLFPKLIIK